MNDLIRRTLVMSWSVFGHFEPVGLATDNAVAQTSRCSRGRGTNVLFGISPAATPSRNATSRTHLPNGLCRKGCRKSRTYKFLHDTHRYSGMRRDAGSLRVRFCYICLRDRPPCLSGHWRGRSTNFHFQTISTAVQRSLGNAASVNVNAARGKRSREYFRPVNYHAVYAIYVLPFDALVSKL